MAGFIEGADRAQSTLLPECLDDWVDESNPVRFIDAFVDGLVRDAVAAGATVLYGTDFGNTSHLGVDPAEIAALQAAGLDGAAILAAGTSAPAGY